jgi:signal transduction histidine kinase/ActR/RegA family two-component response regulator
VPDVIALIGSGSEPDPMLARLARLTLPALGDLCAIHVLDDQGAIAHVASAHVDASKEPLVVDTRGHAVAAVLETARAVLHPRMTRALVAQEAQGAEHLETWRRLGPKSLMVVPLIGRGRTVGALTWAVTETARRYGRVDLRLAETVAALAVLAIERARLLQEAETARSAAEAESGAKDEFLARLSHELRNPLNAVAGWARMLEGGRLSAEQSRRAVEVILRNTAAQTRLLDDLLDMSRVVSGRLTLVRAPVDLTQLIETALEAVRPAAEAKEIALRAALERVSGPLQGDAGRLLQVLGNLLSNAVKFTPSQGSVELRLRQAPSHAEISVSDSGDGMGADILPYIFEGSRPEGGAAGRKQNGLGIGLALVRHLVELHGGTVFAESPGPGLGSTFVIRLPLAATEEPMRPIIKRESVSAAPAALADVRVLVVDDEAAAMELIVEAVAQAGADVRGCQAAAAAMDAIAQWRPHVIVSDIEMPGEDGHTFMRKVRGLAAEQGGRTPALALTALNRTEDRIRSLIAGFDMHVPKPVDLAELRVIVASLARRTR